MPGEGIKSVAGHPHGGNGTLSEAKFRVVGVSNGHQVSGAAHQESVTLREFVRRNEVHEVDRDILPFQSERARGTAIGFRDMLEVMPFEEDGNVADEHEELHVAKANRMDVFAAHKVTYDLVSVWCRACVTGRGLSSKHIVSYHEYGVLGVVGFDCGFMKSEDGAHVGRRETFTRTFYRCGARRLFFHCVRKVSRRLQRLPPPPTNPLVPASWARQIRPTFG